MDKPGAEGIMTPKEARGPDDFPKPGRKDAIGRKTDHQGVEAAGERCFLDRLDQDAPAPGPDDILEKDEQDDQGKDQRKTSLARAMSWAICSESSSRVLKVFSSLRRLMKCTLIVLPISSPE
jgi:hypothetical protein